MLHTLPDERRLANDRWADAGSIQNSSRVSYWGQHCIALTFALVACYNTFSATARPAADSGEPLQTFLRLASGDLSISNALVHFRFNRLEPPILVQFRQQHNAFFARQFCTSEHPENTFCLKDQACGRWEDEYWYYEPGGSPTPLLYQARHTQTDTNSMAYSLHNATFSPLLTLFRTSGISLDRSASIAWRDGRFCVLEGQGHTVEYPRVEYQSGLPVLIELTRSVGERRIPTTLEYGYDAAVGPAGVPVTTRERNGVEIDVQACTLLPAGHVMDKRVFDVPAVLRQPPVGQVVHSNKVDYYVLSDGRLSAMDASRPEREMAQETFGRRFFVVGVAAVTLCVLPLWIALQRRWTKQQTQREER